MSMKRLPMMLLPIAAGLVCGARTVKRPPVNSPEIMADRRITFQIYAPQAKEVLLTGDWRGARDKPLTLAKDDGGIWSATAGPLEAKVYTYTASWWTVFGPSIPPTTGRSSPRAGWRPVSSRSEATSVSRGKNPRRPKARFIASPSTSATAKPAPSSAPSRKKLFTEIFPGRDHVPKTRISATDDSHADDIVPLVRVFGQGLASLLNELNDVLAA